ncbi:hypothetical protein O0I10_013178, partial [Lichtheimia ornata]
MRVPKTSLHCLFWVNMLDDGTSGSNRIRISKQECCMVGSMQQYLLDGMDIRFLFEAKMLFRIPQVAEPLSAIL